MSRTVLREAGAEIPWVYPPTGLKAHIGANTVTGLVHTVKGVAASGSDVSPVPELLHGDEDRLHGDAGYVGAEERLKTERPETHTVRKRRAASQPPFPGEPVPCAEMGTAAGGWCVHATGNTLSNRRKRRTGSQNMP